MWPRFQIGSEQEEIARYVWRRGPIAAQQNVVTSSVGVALLGGEQKRHVSFLRAGFVSLTDLDITGRMSALPTIHQSNSLVAHLQFVR